MNVARWGWGAVALWVALGVAGCGDDGAPPAPGTDASRRDSGPRSDAGPMDGDVGDGDVGDAAPDAPMADAAVPQCADPDGPEVSIVAPTPASDPNEDTVVVGDRVAVTCRVNRAGTPDSRPVDTESISIVRLDASGSVAASPGVTAEGSEYTATFNVSELENGPIRFRCVAQDTAEEPRCGLDELETLLDLGPRIDALMPPAGSIHAERMSLAYRVQPAPLTDGDTEAGVASHELVVAGVTITDVTDVGDGEHNADIDFTDRTVFPEELAGDYELVIRATNMRTPEAATREHIQAFTVDSTGPSISYVEPDVGQLVGGRVRVAVDITDPAGVDESTAILRIGTTELEMRRVEAGSDTFEVYFDASSFESTIRELTLNVTVADIVGNRNTASRVVKLDSVPPIASLDPPDVREGKNTSSQCSHLFDPLGPDSPDDGEIVGSAAEFRARVQELGNQHFGGDGTVTFLAGMRSATIYLLDDTSVPLLVDGDGDGVCDGINPAVEPDPGDPSTAVLIELEGIRPQGTADFTPDASVNDGGEPASAYDGVYASCTEGTASSAPDAICPESSPLPRVIPASLSGDPPGIYGKPPVEATTCVGDAFDFQASVSEGWACLAVRAEDQLGNVGVSPPLHTCFIDGEDPDPCPGAVGTIAAVSEWPQCTDGCTPPPSFVDYPALQLVVPD